MYNVHAIEKGLSRDKAMRPGFGKAAFADLNDAMVVYLRNGFPKESFAYLQGRSIVHRYVEAHGGDILPVHATFDVVDPALQEGCSLFASAGTKVVKLRDKLSNESANFYELAQGRSSVREFSGRPIDMDKVKRCLSNAGKTPSVCNRQGWHVYVVTDKSRISELLRLQRGFKGYPTVPECVLVITVTNNVFLSPVERNEAFIDGGLFSMSVLYGLEHEGLAAVPLNAMMNSSDERAIRNLVRVDTSEQIIMFIAVGSFKDETVVPVSDRRPVSDYVSYVK